MYYSSQYQYTMYSLQQCVCQSPKSAINEQVAQMNMNTRLQMMQMEQCIQNQIPHISFWGYTSAGMWNPCGYPYTGTMGGASGTIGGGGAGACVTINALDSRINQYSPKKESWIERLDRLIFPVDPIRDWVENEVERISKQYAWIDHVRE